MANSKLYASEVAELDVSLNQIELNLAAIRTLAEALASGSQDERSAAHTAIEALTVAGANECRKAYALIGTTEFGAFASDFALAGRPQ